MNVLIVYAHPEPESFNGAMFRQAITTLEAAGHTVKTSDLYAMNFNPVSDKHNFKAIQEPAFFKQQLEELHATEHDGFADDIEEELQKLEWCDLIIFQFPLWWFGMPAMLKGWVDRVLVMGRVYGGGRYYRDGAMTGKRALLSVSAGGPVEAYTDGGLHGDFDAILRPIQRGIFAFNGFSLLETHKVYGPARQSEEQRHQALQHYADRLAHIFDEDPIVVGSY
uniref:NAD(P)H-dependent oxidoreductase n=1 Tax=Thaumasiovibrio occultus TaxID=1891184 RepID=UPI000B35E12C|nr:NAD(P)H-dependent oxidoreductase [Thaumasiovibrio occultus]